MDLGAKWVISNQKQGISVRYENHEHGIDFDCGVTARATPLELILEFILGEGDPGDLVFLDGMFYTQLQKEICA
jgi:hypothetical protein